MRCFFTNAGLNLENQIIDGESGEENNQIAVPQPGRNVVPNAFVLFRFILILVFDADNVFLEIKTAECKACDADKNEKYVNHVLNIVNRT